MKNQDNIENIAKLPIWLQVNEEDLVGFNINKYVADKYFWQLNEYSKLFWELHKKLVEDSNNEDNSETRVLCFLGSILGMNFKVASRENPYSSMIIWADGQRSACLSDYKNKIEIIEALASKVTNIVVKAHLMDIAWLLNRSNYKFGAEASKLFVEISKKMVLGDLQCAYNPDFPPTMREAIEILRRSLQIGISFKKKGNSAEVCELIEAWYLEAEAKNDVSTIFWLSRLDLDFSITNHSTIAIRLEAEIKKKANENSIFVADWWRLAAEAYRRAQSKDKSDACFIEISKYFEEQAENTDSPMIASNHLTQAIQSLHGISGMKDRIRNLRHKLVDRQYLISDELTTFSQGADLTDFMQSIENDINGCKFIDLVFLIAEIAKPRKVEVLEAEARDLMKSSPLSSLIPMVLMDIEGKTIYRQEGGDGNLLHSICQSEAINRNMSILGHFIPIKSHIMRSFTIHESDFELLLQHSPFVPSNLVSTYAKGFTSLLQGDYISSLYILTPLLEASVRKVMKDCGLDVTIIDMHTGLQQDKTITSLLQSDREEMTKIFGNDIIFAIEMIFLEPPGPKIRHKVAHGLLYDFMAYDVDAIYACLFIYRMCFLPLFRYREEFAKSSLI